MNEFASPFVPYPTPVSANVQFTRQLVIVMFYIFVHLYINSLMEIRLFNIEISPFNSRHMICFSSDFSYFIIQLFFVSGTLKKKGFLFKNFSKEILLTF